MEKGDTKKEYREYQKQYGKEMRALSRELGNCTHCHKPKDNPKYAFCSKCRQYHRQHNRKYKQKI